MHDPVRVESAEAMTDLLNEWQAILSALLNVNDVRAATWVTLAVVLIIGWWWPHAEALLGVSFGAGVVGLLCLTFGASFAGSVLAYSGLGGMIAAGVVWVLRRRGTRGS